MRYFTAIAACVILSLFLGWWGLAIGVFVASAVLAFSPRKPSLWNRLNISGRSQSDFSASSQDPREVVITDVAFRSFFQIAGCLAKSDGRISAEEIELATRVMEQLSLSPQYREIAVQCFTEGKNPTFDFERTLNRLQSMLGLNRLAGIVLYEAMLDICEADGFTQQKIVMLLQYAQALGLRQHEAREFILQRQSFDDTGQRTTQTSQSSTELANAYQTLGVNAQDSDAHVKKSYRRLIQQSHPDRLHAMNLPEFLMDAAHRKTQEIQAAWETVKKVRGIS
ncbi:MAG: co-chaperone DjlA [Gammaproteobacteria bacterium]|nr:co-chaperone DjlA [Gammaproteobacteria bacterium]